MGTFITNERAIIMIAHIHALTVSAAAAFGPQVLRSLHPEPYTLAPGRFWYRLWGAV